MQRADTRAEATRLIRAQRWLALATVDEKARPAASYVPFAPVGDAFGIVVSRLAAHTANLLARRPASIMLVDGAADQPDEFSRARLSVAVSVSPLPQGSEHADAVWNALEARQGPTTSTLRMLPDFHAIALAPLDARLVLGFASAHHLAGETVAELLRAAWTG